MFYKSNIPFHNIAFKFFGDDDVGEIFGMLGGFGSLIVELVFIVVLILVGITLFKRKTFSGLLNKFGENGTVNPQIANVIGMLLYAAVSFLLIIILKGIL